MTTIASIKDAMAQARARMEKAVDDFRKTHSITEPLEIVDWTGAYWKKK